MLPNKVRDYLLHGLQAVPAVLEMLCDSVEHATLDARPDPLRFTLREAIAHLADWEGVWLERVRRIAHEDRPHLPGYDEAQWAIDHDYAHSDFADQLARFRAGRNELTAFLRGLPNEAWDRRAQHEEWGELSLSELATLVLGHDGYHLRQVVDFRRIVEG